MKPVVALTNRGWRDVQLDGVMKLQKAWEWKGEEYRVDVYFGTSRSGCFTPMVVMNVYCQGAGTKEVIDDNCDVWKNLFAPTSKEEGNEYYKYLRKHGFQRVDF